MKKKFIFIIASLVIFLNLPFTIMVLANDLEGINKLEGLSSSLYQTAKIKDYGKAKSLIEQISEIIPSIKYNDLTTIEGIEAITYVVIQTKKSLAALEPKHELIMHYTTQLFLAIDALSHKEQPLWHRYYPILKQDIEDIREAIKKENQNNIQVSIKNFQIHYLLIKPSLFVSKKPYNIEKIDSLFTAIVSQTINQNKELLLDQLEESINYIFYGKEQETIGYMERESIIWKTSIGMGLIIFGVLSYVTWRKFRAADYNM